MVLPIEIAPAIVCLGQSVAKATNCSANLSTETRERYSRPCEDLGVTNQQREDLRQNPRTTRVRKIVLEAAAELLIEEGHYAVTPHQVSKATGVARSTIYRHWPDPVTLLLDAIDSVLAPHHTTPIVGDVHEDLVNALTNLRRRLRRHPFREMFTALLDHASRSREFVAAQRRFVTAVTDPLRNVVGAGIDSGELQPTTNPDEAVAQLTGPILYMHVMQRAPTSDELIENAVGGFLSMNATHSQGRVR